MTTTDALQLRADLAQKLETWQEQLAQLNLSDDSNSDTSERSCFLSPVWYRVLYANAKLSIWRPCPLLADLSHDQHSLQNIYDSSIQAITAYSALHKSRKINYSWIALQSIFMAGLSFLYSVSRHFREQHNHLSSSSECCLLQEDPKAIDISQTSRACSNVMVAVAERWNALRHCHEVFDRLSDAVLADALKMQTRSPSTNPYVSQTSSRTTAERISEAMNPDGLSQRSQTTVVNTHSDPQAQAQTLYWNGQLQPAGLVASSSNPHQRSLAVDHEFLHCYDDLQSMYVDQVEDPVMHLSQDWLGYLGGAGGEALFGHEQNAEAYDGQLGMYVE